MKRYIRTKEGKIIDTTKPIEQVSTKNGRGGYRIMPNISGAVKEADTIEELIEVGDLVMYSDGGGQIIHNEEIKEYIFEIEDITELYTKQGNDYILVARKEKGVWQVV